MSSEAMTMRLVLKLVMLVFLVAFVANAVPSQASSPAATQTEGASCIDPWGVP